MRPSDLTMLWLTMIACACTGTGADHAVAETRPDTITAETTQPQVAPALPQGVMALMHCYPDNVIGYEDGYLIMSDSTRILYDDGLDKDFEQMLDNTDPEDMYRIIYRIPEGAPEYLSDAGRARCDALFKKMYGSSSSAVTAKLRLVPWAGGTVRFTGINGAADSLAKVNAALKQHPELQKYLKSSGTFYWRKVRGSNRQSAHSYGIAFDIAVDHSDYWLWRNPKAKETTKITYANKIPHELVRIFERYGFIWGGSWYHYDTMHFEFRPDLIWYAQQRDGTD